MGQRRTISSQLKLEVVRFALDYNEAHGLGGGTAAARLFDVSPAAVSGWLKSYRIDRDRRKPLSATSTGEELRQRRLAEIAWLESEIRKSRLKIESMEARIQKLKKSI